MNNLASEARSHGKVTVIHALRNAAFVMAEEAKVDIILHVLLDEALDDIAAELMAKEGRVSVPTLAIAEAMTKAGFCPGISYSASRDLVALLH